MFETYLKNSGILFLVVFFSGCVTSKVNIPRYEVKAYLQDRPRVDQQITGNAGYLIGAPKSVSSKGKPTRKVFVVEVTEDDTVSPYLIDMDASGKRKKKKATGHTVASKGMKKQQSKVIPVYPTKIELPSFEDDEQDVPPSSAAGENFVQYKVEKDDTLQKISKKFYGSYSKWPKIYKVNKSRIKNPDFLKPGTVLKIPMN